MTDRAAQLRALDGRLCALSEALEHRSATERGRQEVRDEIAHLMARRAALASPPLRRPAPGPLFAAPPELPGVET